jgi:hypothetical protein
MCNCKITNLLDAVSRGFYKMAYMLLGKSSLFMFKIENRVNVQDYFISLINRIHDKTSESLIYTKISE